MHQRVRTFSEKLNAYHRMIVDINRCDYIKYRLEQLEQHRPYRFICNDPRFKEELEDIFDLPFDECQQSYISLLDRRNAIVHKYTMKKWADEREAGLSDWSADQGISISGQRPFDHRSKLGSKVCRPRTSFKPEAIQYQSKFRK
ncbi:hypothetical protein AM587_10001565 [Phytophthora nicotianae]|uniref:Uncharacterized protein n=1 Tax=Phytophthora nicotianae TaxID=4792 RepID=A0A0W8CM29_PHYNI|nr:hypothetical protein AM587_10001565 [Phytophthora nicotianae]